MSPSTGPIAARYAAAKHSVHVSYNDTTRQQPSRFLQVFANAPHNARWMLSVSWRSW